MWRQSPSSFGFSEHLLVALADHAYSARFGTFLLDCERDRDEAGLPTSTVSLWSYVLHPNEVNRFTNAQFVPRAAPLPSSGDGDVNASETPQMLQLGDAAITLLPDTRDEAMVVWPYWAAKWCT